MTGVQTCALPISWLGLSLDEVANQRGGPCISAGGSPTTAWVIPTDEELMIARHTLAVVGGFAR